MGHGWVSTSASLRLLLRLLHTFLRSRILHAAPRHSLVTYRALLPCECLTVYPFVIRGGLCWKTPASEKVSIKTLRTVDSHRWESLQFSMGIQDSDSDCQSHSRRNTGVYVM